MNKFSAIWKEVYLRNVKSGSFIFMVIFPILIFGVIGVISSFISQEQTNAANRVIGVVTEETMVVEQVKALAPSYTFETLDEEEAMQKLSTADIAGYITIARDQENKLVVDLNTTPTSEDINKTPLETALSAVQLQETALKNNVSPAVIAEVMKSQVTVNVNRVDKAALANGQLVYDQGQQTKSFVRQGMAYISVFILYIFILTYGSMVGQEIATEKGTRVMEVVLSSTNARTHFLGKIWGISLVILTQLGLYAILGTIGYFLLDWKAIVTNFIGNIDIWDVAGQMLISTLVFVVIGCVMSISLSALLGSLASKIEDVQKVMTPVMMIAIVGLYIGMFALSMPNHGFVKISSWIPFLTPMVMPFRFAADSVSLLEVLGAAGFSALFTIFIFYISLTFYKSNVLVYSDKGPFQVLKQSLKLMRSNKKK